MLDYTDLLAGRALIAMGIMERGQVIRTLAEHDRMAGGRARLISGLVNAGLISSGMGQRIFATVQRHKRSLAQAIHLEALRRMKDVDPAKLKQATDEYERDPGGHSLDKILLNMGIVSEPEHRRLRAIALEAIERQQARLLRRFRKSLKHHSSRTEVMTIDDESGRARRLTEAGLRGGELSIVAPETLSPPTFGLISSSSGESSDGSDEAEIPLIYEPEEESLRGSSNTTSIVRPSVAAQILQAPSQEPSGPRFPLPTWIRNAGARQGQLICGYRIYGKIGEGGMGIVYYAEHDGLDEPVALKLLPPDRVKDEDAIGRFHREILAMSFFDHENVVAIKDAGQTPEGSFFLSMEFVDGCELMDILEEQDRIPAAQALPIFRQILLGLAAAHRAGILHRDLKPENILVTYDQGIAKLMDFGIAHIMDRSSFEEKIYRSMSGTVTGTPEYLSPEQATDFPVDERSDLYSFGIMMYLCLSGEFPIEAESGSDFITAHMTQLPRPLNRVVPSVSKGLSAIVMKLLEKDPDDRFQRCEDLIAAIDDLARENLR